MPELTRFSVSLEADLLGAFDKFVQDGSFATRSEAIRQLLRQTLTRDAFQTDDRIVTANLTLVYDHHARELAARLIDKQHHHHDLVVSSLHVHLGERHCLEVSILRGSAHDVRHLGDDLLATKGVLHGEMSFAGGEAVLNRWR